MNPLGLQIRNVGLSNETAFGLMEFCRLAEQNPLLPRICTIQVNFLSLFHGVCRIFWWCRSWSLRSRYLSDTGVFVSALPECLQSPVPHLRHDPCWMLPSPEVFSGTLPILIVFSVGYVTSLPGCIICLILRESATSECNNVTINKFTTHSYRYDTLNFWNLRTTHVCDGLSRVSLKLCYLRFSAYGK